MFIVFSGQGSQQENMINLISQEYMNDLVDISKKIDVDLIFLLKNASKEVLNKTENAQLAIFIVSYFISQKFDFSKVKVMAGHSLGQYIALVIAEVISFEEMCFFIKLRSELMSKINGSMLAVLGVSLEEAILISSISSEKNSCCFVANLNSSSQIVLSGDSLAILRAKEVAQSFGKKSVVLATSGPFHTSYMNDANNELCDFIEKMHFSEPKIPVVSNVFAKNDVVWKDELKLHMVSPVRWKESLNFAFENFNVNEAVEIGASPVLKNIALKDGYNIKYYQEL